MLLTRLGDITLTQTHHRTAGHYRPEAGTADTQQRHLEDVIPKHAPCVYSRPHPVLTHTTEKSSHCQWISSTPRFCFPNMGQNPTFSWLVFDSFPNSLSLHLIPNSSPRMSAESGSLFGSKTFTASHQVLVLISLILAPRYGPVQCWTRCALLVEDQHRLQWVIREHQSGNCVLVHTLVAQMVKNLPAMQETWVRSLGWEVPLEKGMATHSSILAWRIPMDRGAWGATVHGVPKSQTWLSN